MSVYIKGISMPTNCWECHFGHGDTGVCVVDFKQHGDWNEPQNCPLVNVPPHGRLIDADALAEHKFVCVPHVTIDGKEAGYAYWLGWNAAIEAIIENAETIIKGDE